MHSVEGMKTYVGAPCLGHGAEIMAPIPTYPEWVRQCTLAPRISSNRQAAMIRLVPWAPHDYTRPGMQKLTVGALWLSPWGEIMAPLP
jgi:hypothetical protein